MHLGVAGLPPPGSPPVMPRPACAWGKLGTATAAILNIPIAATMAKIVNIAFVFILRVKRSITYMRFYNFLVKTINKKYIKKCANR